MTASAASRACERPPSSRVVSARLRILRAGSNWPSTEGRRKRRRTPPRYPSTQDGPGPHGRPRADSGTTSPPTRPHLPGTPPHQPRHSRSWTHNPCNEDTHQANLTTRSAAPGRRDPIRPLRQRLRPRGPSLRQGKRSGTRQLRPRDRSGRSSGRGSAPPRQSPTRQATCSRRPSPQTTSRRRRRTSSRHRPDGAPGFEPVRGIDQLWHLIVPSMSPNSPLTRAAAQGQCWRTSAARQQPGLGRPGLHDIFR